MFQICLILPDDLKHIPVLNSELSHVFEQEFLKRRYFKSGVFFLHHPIYMYINIITFTRIILSWPVGKLYPHTTRIYHFVCKSTNNAGAVLESSHTIYPLQLVSGAPGSGNNWILWLGALHGEFCDSWCLLYNPLGFVQQLLMAKISSIGYILL